MELTTAEKAAIIEQRLRQFRTDVFISTLNRAVAESAGDVQLVAAHDAAIVDAERSITVHETELALIANEPSA